MFGPLKYESFQGNKFGLIFVVHRNNFVFGYPMKTKYQFPEMLRTFLYDFRQIFQSFAQLIDLRIMRPDNAKEFNPVEVRQIFVQFGIIHQFSASTVCREGCVMSMMRTTMLFSKVPRRLWN